MDAKKQAQLTHDHALPTGVFDRACWDLASLRPTTRAVTAPTVSATDMAMIAADGGPQMRAVTRAPISHIIMKASKPTPIPVAQAATRLARLVSLGSVNAP